MNKDQFCPRCGAHFYDWNKFDQSEKELFDAQLISTLKDRVKKLEDACLGCMKWFNRSFTKPNNLDSWYYKMEALLPKELTDEKRNI
jgi:hypothetical protein